MTGSLEALAADAISWAKAQDKTVECELYLSRGVERTFVRRDGVRDGTETAESFGAGVRVIHAGRVGFASAGSADIETLRALWRRAVEQLPQAEPDERRRLPAPIQDKADAKFAASLWDDTLFTRSWGELENSLVVAEKGADKTRVMRSEITESRGEVVVANTLGVNAFERGGSVSLSISAAAEDQGETQVGEGYRSSRRFDVLDPAGAGVEASRRALAAIGARKVRAGKRSVIFEPWVGAEFMELLSDLLSAEEVQGGRSLLAGRLGTSVASALVTLRDDPRLPGAPASARFDDEGVPTQDKTLIERGVLKSFLYDMATAGREGIASNGCGYRGDWSGIPGPGASNLYLAPGSSKRSDLISGTKDGLLVLEVLGMHMVDPVSGEFSIGASGLEISKGSLARPFKGAMLAGNLVDLLGRVDAVADDLEFHSSYAAPTFRVSSLDVA